MIKFKLIDRRTNVSRKIDALVEQLEELPKAFMRKIADTVVFESPVDTGTYMDSHNIGVVGAPSSSVGKPRNQEFEPFAQSAIDRLYSQISALPTDTTKHYISNNALHAWKVEYEYGYAPYTTARAKASVLLEEAIREVMKR